MPGRLRNAPSSDGPEEDVNDAGQIRLKFNDPLSWRAGRAIPVADLLKSLKKLADELQRYEQDTLDLNDAAKVAQELGSAHLLAHKDKGVRARTAVCIVDILMLTAPNAPFSINQLKDIFTTFITSIIPALADPSNAYNQEHIYVLHSLAEYQSIILVTDLDAADKLILSLFTTCFDIISNSSKASTGEEIVKNVEYDMTRLLVMIIDEVPVLPEEVVDTIIVQFLRVDPGAVSTTDRKSKKIDGKQNTLGLKEYPAAYNMAKALCSSCPEKMTNHISTYFNNIIVDASDTFNAHSDGYSKHGHKATFEPDEDSEDLQQLRKAHKLIRELWRACPDVLHNVIPQLEAEIEADSVPLRLLATETIGDVTSGIGVAGPPPPFISNPAQWPALRLGQKEAAAPATPLTTPLAPKPFSQTHASAYQSFVSRRHDRSPLIRAAWASAVGRILFTSGGGLGLEAAEEETLLAGLASMLSDVEERVRIAAVEAVGKFGFTDTVRRLGAHGGVSKTGSVLAGLAERVKDRKNLVREKAFEILGRLWGVAAFEIELGTESVTTTIGQIPQHILSAYFTNDPEIQLSIDQTLFESMVPIGFPPIKADAAKSGSQRQKPSQAEQEQSDAQQSDPDAIRLRRILTLYRDLDEKGRKIFFHMMQRQVKMTQLMTAYLESCEAYNGGVVEDDEADVKARLTKIVEIISRLFPDSSGTSADLWKFAKMHDRRNYQLIRFAMASDSDYRTVTKAIKELTRRIETGQAGSASLLDTLTPLLYRCSLLFLNRSHIPAIIDVSRTNEHGLGVSANEVLKMISSLCPAVLKTQILDMCTDLEANAPSSEKAEDPSAADTLKACAGYARGFPKEIPKDRKLQAALVNYALYSASPRAAKHAVTILMCIAEKKEMHARDLVSKAVKNFSPKSPHALARLATVAQVSLLASSATEANNDAILDIALNKVLLDETSSKDNGSSYTWSDELSVAVQAKKWALQILVNRLRSFKSDASEDAGTKSPFATAAGPVLSLLTRLIEGNGELHNSNITPPSDRPHLRLIASKSILKLCVHRHAFEELITPHLFNTISLVVQDKLQGVRNGFVEQLKRYLTANRLSVRWYTVLFILAYEPDATLLNSTKLWLKNQSQNIIRSSKTMTNGKSATQNVIELLFARLVSLLAHHPDYPPERDGETYAADLLDFARYILFYLVSVSNEENLSLIFHIAQRVKQTRDGISQSAETEDAFSERLYTLSDLSQTIIREYADILSTTKGHEKGAHFLQTWPGKIRLPGHIFKAFESNQREVAMTVAEKDFLEDVPSVREELESVVRAYAKPSLTGRSITRKRKTQDAIDEDGNETDGSTKKKAKKSAATKLPLRKASKSASATASSKKRKSDDSLSKTEQPSRKSSRKSGASITYADVDSDDADEEMDDWNKASPKKTAKSTKVTSDDEADAMDIDNESEAEPEDADESPAKEDVSDEQVSAEEEEGTPSPPPKSSSRKPLRTSKVNGNTTPTPSKTSKAKSNPTISSQPKIEVVNTNQKSKFEINDDDDDDPDDPEEDEVSPAPKKSTTTTKKTLGKKTTPLKAGNGTISTSATKEKKVEAKKEGGRSLRTRR